MRRATAVADSADDGAVVSGDDATSAAPLHSATVASHPTLPSRRRLLSQVERLLAHSSSASTISDSNASSPRLAARQPATPPSAVQSLPPFTPDVDTAVQRPSFESAASLAAGVPLLKGRPPTRTLSPGSAAVTVPASIVIPLRRSLSTQESRRSFSTLAADSRQPSAAGLDPTLDIVGPPLVAPPPPVSGSTVASPPAADAPVVSAVTDPVFGSSVFPATDTVPDTTPRSISLDARVRPHPTSTSSKHLSGTAGAAGATPLPPPLVQLGPHPRRPSHTLRSSSLSAASQPSPLPLPMSPGCVGAAPSPNASLPRTPRIAALSRASFERAMSSTSAASASSSSSSPSAYSSTLASAVLAAHHHHFALDLLADHATPVHRTTPPARAASPAAARLFRAAGPASLLAPLALLAASRAASSAFDSPLSADSPASSSFAGSPAVAAADRLLLPLEADDADAVEGINAGDDAAAAAAEEELLEALDMLKENADLGVAMVLAGWEGGRDADGDGEEEGEGGESGGDGNDDGDFGSDGDVDRVEDGDDNVSGGEQGAHALEVEAMLDPVATGKGKERDVVVPQQPPPRRSSTPRPPTLSHSSSWPNSLHVSPQDAILAKAAVLARGFLAAPARSCLGSDLCLRTMAELQSLLMQQKRLVVAAGPRDADFVARLVFVMAPFARFVDAMKLQLRADYSSPGSGRDTPTSPDRLATVPAGSTPSSRSSSPNPTLGSALLSPSSVLRADSPSYSALSRYYASAAPLDHSPPPAAATTTVYSRGRPSLAIAARGSRLPSPLGPAAVTPLLFQPVGSSSPSPLDAVDLFDPHRRSASAGRRRPSSQAPSEPESPAALPDRRSPMLRHATSAISPQPFRRERSLDAFRAAAAAAAAVTTRPPRHHAALSPHRSLAELSPRLLATAASLPAALDSPHASLRRRSPRAYSPAPSPAASLASSVAATDSPITSADARGGFRYALGALGLAPSPSRTDAAAAAAAALDWPEPSLAMQTSTSSSSSSTSTSTSSLPRLRRQPPNVFDFHDPDTVAGEHLSPPLEGHGPARRPSRAATAASADDDHAIAKGGRNGGDIGSLLEMGVRAKKRALRPKPLMTFFKNMFQPFGATGTGSLSSADLSSSSSTPPPFSDSSSSCSTPDLAAALHHYNQSASTSTYRRDTGTSSTMPVLDRARSTSSLLPPDADSAAATAASGSSFSSPPGPLLLQSSAYSFSTVSGTAATSPAPSPFPSVSVSSRAAPVETPQQPLVPQRGDDPAAAVVLCRICEELVLAASIDAHVARCAVARSFLVEQHLLDERIRRNVALLAAKRDAAAANRFSSAFEWQTYCRAVDGMLDSSRAAMAVPLNATAAASPSSGVATPVTGAARRGGGGSDSRRAAATLDRHIAKLRRFAAEETKFATKEPDAFAIGSKIAVM
ncbi:hypothetical protein HK405_005073, partial [Cladochytrium tenue]